MSSSDSRSRHAELQANYRLYARLVAEIDRGMVASQFRTAEWRTLLELRFEPHVTGKQLGARLGLDRAHLSRAINSLIDRGLVKAVSAPGHKSQRLHSLSEKGAIAASALQEQWSALIENQLKSLPHADLLTAIKSQGDISRYRPKVPELRGLGPESYGWMVQQASQVGDGELSKTVQAIRAYVNFDLPQLGAAVFLHDLVVGTCIVTTIDEDQCVGEIAGFYVTKDAWGLAARKLLNAVIRGCRDVTLTRVVGLAGERDPGRAALFNALGFFDTGTSHTRLIGPTSQVADKQREYHLTL